MWISKERVRLFFLSRRLLYQALKNMNLEGV